MQVLWVIKGLGPGGAERLLAAAAGQHDHHAFDIECAYVLPYKDHLAEELHRAGVPCSCLSSTRRDLLWPIRLCRLVRSGRYDVVHSHSPLPAAVVRLATLGRPKGGRPALVTTEHNAWSTFASPTRLLNRLTAGMDDATYAVSEETRRSMAGPAADRCLTLHHGIDVESVAAEAEHRAAVRAELGVGQDEVVVGTVANYREQKDYPNLLHAAAALKRAGVRVKVVAVGQGPLQQEIQVLRRQLGLEQSVLLTGWRPDATRVMAGFDVFTLASKYEGLPVALMEASALGLPIVATEVGGVAETLREDDAVLVPAADPAALAAGWAEVVRSPERRQRLGLASLERASGFDVRRTVREYERCYHQLEGHAPRREHQTIESPSRSRPSGLDIRPATDGDRPAVLALLSRSLGWEVDARHAALFEWKHDQNPFGPSPMWVAVDGQRIVGLRVFMRWEFCRGQETLRAVRAVDTATDPDYQGRGLFSALTMNALDELQRDGVDFVFNTPNSRSLPGYLKMGWTVVGKLPAVVRPKSLRSLMATARARTPSDLWSLELDAGGPFERVVTTTPDSPIRRDTRHRDLFTSRSGAFLRWRYGSPLLRYRALSDGEGILVVRGRQRGPARELVIADAIGLDSRHADDLAVTALKADDLDHALRCGSSNLSKGFVPLPGTGPVLTFRSLNQLATPPLANWRLSMGDLELF